MMNEFPEQQEPEAQVESDRGGSGGGNRNTRVGSGGDDSQRRKRKSFEELEEEAMQIIAELRRIRLAKWTVNPSWLPEALRQAARKQIGSNEFRSEDEVRILRRLDSVSQEVNGWDAERPSESRQLLNRIFEALASMERGALPNDHSDFFKKMTESAALAMLVGHNVAVHFGHNRFGSEHLLLGLVSNDPRAILGAFEKIMKLILPTRQHKSIAAEALSAVGVTYNSVFSLIQEFTGFGKGRRGGVAFTSNIIAVFGTAEREAELSKANYISSEHLLLGILAVDDCTANKLLRELEINLGALESAIREKEEAASGWLRG